MSSKPSTEGVEELRVMLRIFRDLQTRLAALRRAASELPGIEEEAATLQRRIVKALDDMDVASRGNFGWEGRVVWFLTELNAQGQE